MAFFLTILYIGLTVLSPDEVIPGLVPYRPLLWIAIVVVIASIPQIMNSPDLLRLRQFWLAVAFTLVVLLSNAVHLWFGGVLFSMQEFLPNVIVLFLLLIHVNTFRRLKIVSAITCGLAMVLAAQGIAAYYFGYGGSRFLFTEHVFRGETIIGEFHRIRALGTLNDPNDLAQFFEVSLPLPWLLWRGGRSIRNLFLVLLPTAYLAFAIFLTHSRGALLGLAVLVLVALRTKVGSVLSAMLTAGGIAAALALNFTGGRGISAASGADRLDLWGTGLEMFKSSPIFGVGYGQFTQSSSHTAHNSFVLCLAELGGIGTWLWVALLVTAFAGLTRYIAKNVRPSASEIAAGSFEAPTLMVRSPAPPLAGNFVESNRGAAPATLLVQQISELSDGSSENDPEDLLNRQSMARWANVLRMSMLGFVVTAWFLSRAYSTTFFLAVGLPSAYLAIRLLQHPDDQAGRWMRITTGIEVAGIIFVYLSVRLGQ